MKIIATVSNGPGRHDVRVSTNGNAQELPIPPKATGGGSSVNGGELLMLALATCYCNDLYREAARLQIPLESVEVEASATFGGVGIAAKDIRYTARVKSTAAPSEIERLLAETDAVAEVHNTLRRGATVTMEKATDADPSK